MILRLAGLAGLLYGIIATMAASEQAFLAQDNLADFVRPEKTLPTLADLLTLESQASIFYSYSRETDMSALFTQSVKEGEGTTVFVPTNKAVQALAKKPHEDPEGDVVASTETRNDVSSKRNVERWVGAHIIPSSDVDFTSSEPYNTLTAGTTITFSAVSSKDRLPYEPVIDADAAHLGSLKGKGLSDNTDSAHLGAVKNCPHLETSSRLSRKHGHPVNTDNAYFASIKGSGSLDHDAAHFTNVKGSSAQTPPWKEYELNDGVHIISMKKASNGVMYLIDGTVPV